MAGKEILEVYNSGETDVQMKEDNFPVTRADKVSEEIISKYLKELYPNIPIISEESEAASYEDRSQWEYFWLVDPLDGTKEFISRNGEFTVNIALMYKDSPVMGVIYAPAVDLLYYAQKGSGAFKKAGSSKVCSICIYKEKRSPLIVTRSRSHASEKENSLISQLGDVKEIIVGSSIKFCYVAEGKADIYIRFAGSMEWDIAAGQCIAEEAGAEMRDIRGNLFLYNKKVLKNEALFCFNTTVDISLLANRN